LLFLSAVLFVVLRDIVAGRNWRNLTITVVLAMLTGLNVSYHMEESPVAWLPIGYVLTGVAETWAFSSLLRRRMR